jgi:hypothetical protein
VVLEVGRTRQRRAVACHASQTDNNPALWRRLALLDDTESLHWLRPPSPGTSPTLSLSGGNDVPEPGTDLVLWARRPQEPIRPVS